MVRRRNRSRFRHKPAYAQLAGGRKTKRRATESLPLPLPDQHDGIKNLFYKDPKKYGSDEIENGTPWRYSPQAYVDLPWGSPVIMLSYESNPGSRSKRQHIMRILFDNKYLVGELSDKQANAWFCYPKTFKKRYNGILEKLNENKE